jgi:hypothetical protein
MGQFRIPPLGTPEDVARAQAKLAASQAEPWQNRFHGGINDVARGLLGPQGYQAVDQLGNFFTAMSPVDDYQSSSDGFDKMLAKGATNWERIKGLGQGVLGAATFAAPAVLPSFTPALARGADRVEETARAFHADESGALKIDLDPFGFQNTKMDDFIADADIGITDAGVNLPRKPMRWEDTEGKVIIPFYGDRTSGGSYVDSVNDIKFDKPVYTEGGVDFLTGPAAQADGAVWASNSNITKRLHDTASKAAESHPDREIIGLTGSMSPDANDFATMTGGTVGEMVQQVGIPKKTAGEFNEIMLQVDPNFVGVNSPNLRTWLETASSPARKSFIRLADTQAMKRGGFPDMGLGRYAVTDPTQRDMAPGMFGLGAARIDVPAARTFNAPKAGQLQASVPHSTYNSQIKGDYLGSLPPVPQDLIFRDVIGPMEGQFTKAGGRMNSAHKTHAIKTKVPAQLMTPEILDGILGYMARHPR